MGHTTITCKITMRWWLRVYLDCVVFTANITGLNPDWDKVRYWVGRGMKITLCSK
ncbi:hypothetical protein [Pseudomonas extremaustralis]|uniref:Uncharacterized protein n=1 Tax=Pseudomonas extremaustralis TaxID=359110 RepID=A0ABY0N2N3_9PSED|nr:hypothetical protein [Pseudomonas extremaustralis]SDE70175.1 hypothetical protein SAMN05216591_0668 [Pseudomonas extremaustralis]